MSCPPAYPRLALFSALATLVLISRLSFASDCENCESAERERLAAISVGFLPGIRLRGHEVAYKCWGKVPLGTSYKVKYMKSQPCKLPLGIQAQLAKYGISRTERGPRIDLRVRFKLGSEVSEERAETMFREARRCIGPIRALWARYGIEMVLGLDADRWPHSRSFDHEVRLIDDMGRSDAGTFYFKGQENNGSPEFAQFQLCRMMAHETGHFLGLDDEYGDSDCPDRYFVAPSQPPYSLMSYEGASSFDDLELHPRHIYSVIQPLCSRGKRGGF